MAKDHRWSFSRSRVALLALFAIAAAAGVGQLVSQSAASENIDPASRSIEYRPTGYFPKGFPLYGKVRLLTAPIVEMGKRYRVRIEYTVGDMAIEPGMAIEVWKHFTSDVEEFQVDNPNAPAYFSADITDPAVKTRTVKYTNWIQRNKISVFPYRKCAAVVVDEGTLKQGDKVTLDLGGQQGVRMQHYAENLFNFRIAITKDGKPYAYAGDAAMKVTGGELCKLRVQAPSIVKRGQEFPVEIVPTDEWYSLARNHTGLSFHITSGGVSPGAFLYDEQLEHYISRDFTAPNTGVYRIRVETADGRYKGLSNPIWVESNPDRRVYFGEMHQHTYLADGRGVFDELYMYGRKVGLLDFAAVSPHHMPLSVTGPILRLKEKWPTDQWPALQAATKVMNGWEGLVSILGYEYSVGTNKGGHHNIYYNADRAPTTMELDPKHPMAPIGQMLKTLRFANVPTLVIPHIGGGPPMWTHPPDQRIERLFEIASVHGIFEEAWQKHLEAGLRQGVIGAGDTHTTSMGIAYPGIIYVMSNALAGVYAKSKDRDAIWNGLYQRRTYAVTTNQRILMDFRVNGEPMGGEISSVLKREAHIKARVSGTKPILRAELLKNCKVIHTINPSRMAWNHLRVVWGDNKYRRRAAIGRTSGKLWCDGGELRLEEKVHIDQAFESIEQQDARTIRWTTAANSNDRDGVLLDISGATGTLHFELSDPAAMSVGTVNVDIPLAELKQKGYQSASFPIDKLKDSYMKKLDLDPAFFAEFELVNPNGPMDITLEYQDREPLKPGDYYYLRIQQIDTNKAWSSPVWVN